MKKVGIKSTLSSSVASLATISPTFLNDSNIPLQYPNRSTLYLDPPTFEINIEEFETLAISRLELLRAMDTALLKNLSGEDLNKWMNDAEHGTKLFLHGNDASSSYPLEEERKRDQASHFILRLAFCSSSDSQRWFITQESALFKFRFQSSSHQERMDFIQRILNDEHEIQFLDPQEKHSMIDILRSRTKFPSSIIEQEEFIKVPWQKVADLISKRSVYLNQGMAFVPKSECFSIAMTRFKRELERELERTAKELPQIRDDRIIPLLEEIKSLDPSALVGDSLKGFIKSKGNQNGMEKKEFHDVTLKSASDVNGSIVHFPLCMQLLHGTLKANCHLRYQGRQQYGLFLKSIGLTLTEALLFWRKSFSRKISDDQFNKEYSYNIRHNYGQEGKRANYGPQSCTRIINGPTPNLGVDEAHGCPFKHVTSMKLKEILSKIIGPTGIKLKEHQINELIEMTKGHHYQPACTKLLEWTKGAHLHQSDLETITYPSSYYEISMKSILKK